MHGIGVCWYGYQCECQPPACWGLPRALCGWKIVHFDFTSVNFLLHLLRSGVVFEIKTRHAHLMWPWKLGICWLFSTRCCLKWWIFVDQNNNIHLENTLITWDDMEFCGNWRGMLKNHVFLPLFFMQNSKWRLAAAGFTFLVKKLPLFVTNFWYPKK